MEHENPIYCPECRSHNITEQVKGFSSGKAFLGGLLLGKEGIQAGFIGSGKTEYTCLDCGRVFELNEFQARYNDDKEEAEYAKSLAHLPAKDREEKVAEFLKERKRNRIILASILYVVCIAFFIALAILV